MIAARQELDLRPQLERLDRLVLRSEGLEPDALTFAFRPLWQLDEPARAALALSRAQTTQAYAGLGLWPAAVMARLPTPMIAGPPRRATAARPRCFPPSSDPAMPYTVPSPADLAARFPAFAAVPPATLAGAIAEAQTRVDTGWLPDDYAIAIMLLAAHTLTLDGLGTGAEAAAAAAGTLGYSSLRSGNLSLDRAPQAARAAEPTMLAETTYGRRYLALLKINRPAVLVP